MASLFSLKAAVCLFVFALVGSASSRKNRICPFENLFHSGDGFFDVGNAVQTPPDGPSLPANNFPYGITTPGHPSGRWSDGLLDIDYGGATFGFPTVTPSLSGNATTDAVIFAWASSPVMDHSFFSSRDINLTSYAMPLNVEIEQFKTYLSTYRCTTPAECAAIMADSLFIFGDIEANDIGIPLAQGKSIEEVMTYVPFVTETSINVTRELIRMGSTRLLHPGNAPIGCFPYLLTKLASNDPTDYDSNGCLKKVNDLIRYKNQQLSTAIDALKVEFPNLYIFYGDVYGAFETVLNESLSGPNKNISLTACCGIGGKYNYDSGRVCGTTGVPVCADPLQYIHWDGIHLTQNAQKRLNKILIQFSSVGLNCTSPSPSPSPSINTLFEIQ